MSLQFDTSISKVSHHDFLSLCVRYLDSFTLLPSDAFLALLRVESSKSVTLSPLIVKELQKWNIPLGKLFNIAGDGGGCFALHIWFAVSCSAYVIFVIRIFTESQERSYWSRAVGCAASLCKSSLSIRLRFHALITHILLFTFHCI